MFLIGVIAILLTLWAIACVCNPRSKDRGSGWVEAIGFIMDCISWMI